MFIYFYLYLILFFLPCFRRERLIHLLALRPYKKPELYDRLLKGEFSTTDTYGGSWRRNKKLFFLSPHSVETCSDFLLIFFFALICHSISEGISNRDKNIYLNVLKSISYLRDNTYLLHRHLWNDVHEDWPFYSDQDRSTLKR